MARTAFNRGVVLHQQGDAEGARAAYQQAVESGHPRLAGKAARNLGLMLIDLGDTSGAQAAFEKAVEFGHPDTAPKAARSLGLLLAESGDVQGARAAFQTAVDSGYAETAPKAALDLGILLRRQGDQDGARAAFQVAVDSADREAASKAALNLGQILREQGDPLGAEGILRTAVDCEDPAVAAAATVELGLVFEQHGDPQRAILAYRRVLDCDDPQIAAIAASNLGNQLAKHRPAEAELLLRRAADAGWAPAMTTLATLLIRRSRGDERALASRLGAALGSAGFHTATGLPAVIAVLVSWPDSESHDPWLAPPEAADEAERLYRRAIDAGEKNALNRLAALLIGRGRLDEAEHYYRKAIDAGVAVAWTNLARLVMRRDPAAASGHGTHAEQVRDLLERGAQAGDPEALTLLGTLAAERDDIASAEHYLSRACESGSTTARILLLILTAEQARPERTQALIDQIVADDDQLTLDALETTIALADAPDLLDALRNARSTRGLVAWHRFASLLATMPLGHRHR